MKISVIAPHELTAAHIDAWHSLQSEANGCYRHPFFSPDYAQLVASVHSAARVAVLEDGAEIGFFPFQTNPGRAGVPIGDRLTDFQGAIVPQSWDVPWRQLLRCCGLKAWRFDHLILNGPGVAPDTASTASSPWIDLSGGYDGYIERMKQGGSSAIKQTERKTRKMEREVGPLRLEVHDPSDQAFQQLLDWKTAYIRERGAYPLFETDWILKLLQRIRHTNTDHLAGRFSVLYAGERIVAAHLGICNQTVCHWWITSYDAQFHQYSPGTILLLRLARAMAEQGIQRLDLGKGTEVYKQRLMTDEQPLGEGAVSRTRSRAWWEHTRNRCRTRLRDSAWSPVLQKSKQLIRYGVLSSVE